MSHPPPFQLAMILNGQFHRAEGHSVTLQKIKKRKKIIRIQHVIDSGTMDTYVPEESYEKFVLMSLACISLTWNPHTLLRKKQVSTSYRMLLPLFDARSRLILSNHLLIYNSILKPTDLRTGAD